ncbi:c-type cytochrome [Methylobrevis albus]|uniref:c-type cytochrome n=1 Tax=Methylobrevis albus TaxID=2793297 RepID=UPI0038B38065
MIKRLFGLAALAALLGGGGFWLLTAPETLAETDLPAHTPDIANGERIFHAGGCSSCHAAPGAKGEDKLRLAGGVTLNTDFGRFHVPNISPDPDTGIGGWSTLDFVNAMVRGVGRRGEHLYPAFPYTSYARMTLPDVIDLKGYMDTLPAVPNQVAAHELPFPFSLRRGLGLWKRLYLDPVPAVVLADASDLVRRGQYLVEGPGHCGECHTPRDAIGGLDRTAWLAGAPNPDGDGRIPNITPDSTGIGAWSAEEIAYSLESGFTPEFDSFGGSMVAVQENLAALPAEDREAIAAYLKAVPARAGGG